MKQNGFTLAELLIALAILGVIATFTIPKVLTAQQDENKKAVYKETIATISQIIYNGHISGELCTVGAQQYFADHLNYIKRCTSDTVTEGCWAGPHAAGDDEPDGYILANGAAIVDLEATDCANNEGITLDWNGEAGPNLEGDDRMFVEVYYNDTDDFPGRVIPYPGYPNSIALFEEIFN